MKRILSNIIKNEAPNHIFICVDEDPNKTHNKCFDIFKNIIGNKNYVKI